MITLFRRIRQKLIDSGNITKYLFYALGEILLVPNQKNRPFRDKISVAYNMPTNKTVPLGTGYVAERTEVFLYGVPTGTLLVLSPHFYQYVVPMGQVKNQKLC